MRFGNWRIMENSIEWAGKSLQRFVIDRPSLLEITRTAGMGDELYKWIVTATDEDWLTADELYDLNYAFTFAAGKWQQDLNYQVLDQTMEYQFDLLDEEEETQF